MAEASPRRLIEVDLPVKRISEQARREKSIRHGHISTLHIWWARRPLAACRSVVLAGLLPDPADNACPESFRVEAMRALKPIPGKMRPADDRLGLRQALLEFIADFSDWDRSADPTYLKAARSLVRAAYPDGRPTVLDPFAGGGAIPLEALRVGADAWANEINPVATEVLIAELVDAPQGGSDLADAFRRAAAELASRLHVALDDIYAVGPGRECHAFLWARTALCEGPGCGLRVPLIRNLQIVRIASREVGIQLKIGQGAIATELVTGAAAKAISGRTVNNGSLICPSCGFVTRNSSLQQQAMGGRFGVRLLAVIDAETGESRRYRNPDARDHERVELAARRLTTRFSSQLAELNKIPLNPIRPSPRSRGVSAVTRYGVDSFAKLLLPRQLLAMMELCTATAQLSDAKNFDPRVRRLLALVVGRVADRMTMSTRWDSMRETIAGAFGGKALALVWDFAELNPLSPASGGFAGAVDWVAEVVEYIGRSTTHAATVYNADARRLPVPDQSVDAMITDPPYSDQIPYADMAEYFDIWHRFVLGDRSVESFRTAKRDEIVVNAADPGPQGETKTAAYYQQAMGLALNEARRTLKLDGIGIVVFADKTTAGWEALLNSVVTAGWTVTASWPIDTEMGARLRARDTAALASSVHLVCRPRPATAGVGDWSVILRELQPRVDSWMRRLAAEGVVGADAIFACLGPAIELFSRYERVETAAGVAVPLGGHSATGNDFLTQVWASVARAALKTIFDEAEASGFEADGRLAAVWLWTVGPGTPATNGGGAEDSDQTEDEDDTAARPKTKVAGFALPYDTARKLAQPLGADLTELSSGPGSAFELKGDTARLLSVRERRAYLFPEGWDPAAPRQQVGAQVELFEGFAPSGNTIPRGGTTLDRLHQSMLLFADEKGDALRRLLVEDGAGQDPRFWRLADAMSKLYPSTSPEKRWVDGVLARKRGLGL